MLRFLVILTAMMFGTALLALNAERLLLYHFDETRISPAAAGEPRLSEVLWQTPVGDRLVLWVAPPRDGRPTILYFHGNAGNLAGRVGRFRGFLDKGYGVVAMAYPGSSGSTGEQNSEVFQTLAEAVFADLPNLSGPGPVVVYGESLGTGVAVQLAADMGDGLAGLVLESPYTSILDVGRAQYPRLADWLYLLPNPWPSIDRIGAVATPLLILHGAEDQVVPTDMGRALFAAAGSDTKRLIVVEGAGHNDVWQANAQSALYRFLADR